MIDPRPGPIFSRADRMDEVRRFGSCIFFALMSFILYIATTCVLVFRTSIESDTHIFLYASLCGGIASVPFVYFGAIQKRLIIIPILRIWTITFLTLQTLVFLVAVAAFVHYGIHNPAIEAVDCGLAAGLSLIGLFFGTFGLIRGIRHRWFAHVLVPGYTRG